MHAHDTICDAMRRHGVTRRRFLRFCSPSTAALGAFPDHTGKMAHPLETRPPTLLTGLGTS